MNLRWPGFEQAAGGVAEVLFKCRRKMLEVAEAALHGSFAYSIFALGQKLLRPFHAVASDGIADRLAGSSLILPVKLDARHPHLLRELLHAEIFIAIVCSDNLVDLL